MAAVAGGFPFLTAEGLTKAPVLLSFRVGRGVTRDSDLTSVPALNASRSHGVTDQGPS
jgi:hypothetical protein